jgi:hypothetical protein
MTDDHDETGTVVWVSDTVICRLVKHDTDPCYEVRLETRNQPVRAQFFSHDSDASRYATELLYAHGGDRRGFTPSS